jgi:hypothetical protein
MKLKCIKSNDSVFKVGKLYDVINQFGSFYSLKPDSERWPKGYTLQGKYLAFEIYKPKEKKQITVEQALEDGFIKTKSLKRCIKEGFVTQILGEYEFTNVKFNPGLDDSMLSDFGTVQQVYSTQRNINNSPLITLRDNLNWPIEVIEK